jgi:transcriptional regulator with XRE-family HTH domain
MGRLTEKDKKLIKKFGYGMRKIRLSKNWTLEEAEERAVASGWKKCSWKHLQKIETGQKDISLTTIFKLAVLYQVETSQLF